MIGCRELTSGNLRLLILATLIATTCAVPLFNQEEKSEETIKTTTSNSTEVEQTKDDLCLVDDVVYAAGDVVPAADSCRRCECAGSAGVICTPVQCPMSTGCKAVQRSGQCCPEYSCECTFESRVYDNGARIPEAGSPCEVCYCRSGSVECAVLECFWRDDCEPRYEQGRCCPKFDHCPPPADSQHASRPLNNSTPQMAEIKSTPSLPVVSFHPVFLSTSPGTTTERDTTTEQSVTEANTESVTEQEQTTVRTPTQDSGLVTESAVEAPSEPSFAPENLVARNLEVTTTQAPSDEVTTILNEESETTEISEELKHEVAESRTVDDEVTTAESATETDLPPETTTILQDDVTAAPTQESAVNTEDSPVEPEARFDLDEAIDVGETTTEAVTTTDNTLNVKIAEVTSTEASVTEHHDDTLRMFQSEPVNEELETTTNKEELTTGNSVQDKIEARTDETLIEATTLHDNTDEMTTQEAVESRTEEVPMTLVETTTESANTETPESNNSIISSLKDNLAPAVSIDIDDVNTELVKNISSNIFPAQDSKNKDDNVASPSLIEKELAKSIEKAEFPFNNTHTEEHHVSTPEDDIKTIEDHVRITEEHVRPTEKPEYLLNDGYDSSAQVEILTPIIHPIMAPAYSGYNDWRIAPLQEAPEESLAWRDDVDLSAGVAADYLYPSWSQQHLRRRRNVPQRRNQ